MFDVSAFRFNPPAPSAKTKRRRQYAAIADPLFKAAMGLFLVGYVLLIVEVIAFTPDSFRFGTIVFPDGSKYLIAFALAILNIVSVRVCSKSVCRW